MACRICWKNYNFIAAAKHFGAIKLRASRADMRFMTERRSEVRMLCADMVELSWKDCGGKDWRTVALLEDISASGACFQLEAAIPLEVEVHWHSPKREYAGWVRYCVYREIGYFAGIEFHQSSRWSRKEFKPQHLLDLKRLLARTRW